MVITVQQLVKKSYQKILAWTALISLIVVLAFFLFTPSFKPSPYKLKEEVMEIIEVPDEIEIPPPPNEIEMPKVRVEIEISDEASEDDTIEDTSFDSLEDMPPPAASSGSSSSCGA